MNETGRVTSTANKISRAWLRRLFWIFFRLNLLLLLISVAAFCYARERAALGADWIPQLRRTLEMGGFETMREFLDALGAAQYVFFSPSGARFSAEVSDFLVVLKPAAAALLVGELLFFFGQMFSGRRTARRLLRPLDRMARAAR